MNGIFLEETIDMMKECLTRMEAIRDEDISSVQPAGPKAWSGQMIICHRCKDKIPNDGSHDRGWIVSFLHKELTRCPKCQPNSIPEPIKITAENWMEYWGKVVWTSNLNGTRWFPNELYGFTGEYYLLHDKGRYKAIVYTTDPTEYLKGVE